MDNNNTKINIVLFEPEISGNVGSIMRTCWATNATLHLIEPLGFFLDDRFLKRASVNYIENINFSVYNSLDDFFKNNSSKNKYFITRYGQNVYSDINFVTQAKITNDLYFIFGKESTGIPMKILKENQQNCLRIPMIAEVRSLNLSNCVSVIIYEVLRQLKFQQLSKFETQKGANWINDFTK